MVAWFIPSPRAGIGAGGTRGIQARAAGNQAQNDPGATIREILQRVPPKSVQLVRSEMLSTPDVEGIVIDLMFPEDAKLGWSRSGGRYWASGYSFRRFWAATDRRLAGMTSPGKRVPDWP